MKKFFRSNSLISQKLKINSKIYLLREKLNNQRSSNEIKRKSKQKNFAEFNINNQNLNKNAKKLNTELNLIRVDYFSEEQIIKKKEEETLEKNIQNLAELLTLNNSKNESKEERALLFLLQHKEKKGFETETNKLIEIIKYILSKKQKSEKDIIVIKAYFSQIEQIFSLFLSLNSENMFIKLLSEINFEEYKKNYVIFKESDKGEKLYITLKGSTSVLAQKEGKDGMCTQFEYIKYLIVLYLYQEMGMLSKVIFYNKSIIKVKEPCIITLFMAFRFFKFYKEQDFFLVENGLKYEDEAICEFINNQPLIKEFIYKKLDFEVEDSIHIFNYTQNIIKELYLFYERQIEEINQKAKEKKLHLNTSFNSNQNNIEEDKNKNKNIMFHPNNLKDLNIYGENIRNKYNSKNKKSKNKIREEIFNKIFEIKEISKEIIYQSNSKDYLERLDFDSILQNIRKDNYLNGDKSFKLKEEQKNIRYLNYQVVNTINQFQLFGELALNSLNKKRTATIITNEHCYFGILYKKIYDSYLKVAQIKSRVRSILYFTEGPIFKGISPNIFLNEFYYYLNKVNVNKGHYLFNKGDIRKKIYFVEKGEFELGCKLTLEKIGDIMNKLGGISDDKKEKYLCDLFIEFKQIYENKNMNIKICILDNNYIIGLDDICLDNKHLYDCKCVSTDGAEIYEFDYQRYEKALKEFSIIYNNNIEYVNKRRESFIKILFDQRNSLVEFEYSKLRGENIRDEKIKKVKLSKKFNILRTLMKEIKYNKNQLINLAKYKKENNKPKEEINNSIEDKKHKTLSNESKNNKDISSMRTIFQESKKKMKLSEPDSKRDKSKTIQSFNKYFYPKIDSEKKLMINMNNTKTVHNFFNNKNKKEIKNKRKKLNQLKLEENNNINYDFTDSNLIFNDKNKNKILESLDIYINQTVTVEKSLKKNLIPRITNYKISLNKKRIKNIPKNKIYKTPTLIKECSKEYFNFKTKPNIKEKDTLFSEYQKNVYNIFYPKHCKKFLEIKINENETKEKFFKNFTENINSIKDFSLDKETLNGKKDKSTYVNFNREKNQKKINDINYFNVGIKNKNKGFIDCLCFDNWAEKRQFEKNLLSYKIS